MERLSAQVQAVLRAVYGSRPVPQLEDITESEFRLEMKALTDRTWAAVSQSAAAAPRGVKRGVPGADPAAIRGAKRPRAEGSSASYKDDDMKAHYDMHGRRQQTGAERARGIAYPLKKFHNKIKDALIRRFCSRRGSSGGGLRLLDIACGRGGDIPKWGRNGLNFVRGIDLSPSEIEEAQSRWRNRYRAQFPRLTVTFEQSDNVGRSPLQGLSTQYDAVTVMFAIHYFFKNEAMLRALMRNAAAAIKDRGYFFGCCPDGKAVLKELNQRDRFENSVLCLNRLWEGRCQVFGSAFNFKIKDTVTDGGFGSREYLVFSSVFKGIAAEYGFFPVTELGPELERMLHPDDRSALLKKFVPRFENKDLEVASRINAAFCFQMNRSRATKRDP